jgi:hypothetical protein
MNFTKLPDALPKLISIVATGLIIAAVIFALAIFNPDFHGDVGIRISPRSIEFQLERQ